MNLERVGVVRTLGGFAASLVAAALLGLVACSPGGDRGAYDLILRNAVVVDGTGRTRYSADIAVSGGTIARVGDLARATGAEEIDVSGLFVAPGFINLHSHALAEGLPTAVNMLSQGVTTVILNADGGGPPDLSDQLASAEAGGLAINVGANVGLNSIWARVNGPDDIRPTADQIAEMRTLVEEGLAQGAWGVSAGLDYTPAYYARISDIVEVLAETNRWRTLFTNHDRLTPEMNFSSMVGMRETVEIGETAGLMPLITHMKVQGREQGTVEDVLAMMDAATGRGAYTAADVYPYLAGQTSLAALIIPGWAQEGGRDAMRARFADGVQRARIIAEADEALEARFHGPGGVFLPESQRELTDVMAELGVASGGEAVVRLLEEDNPGAILRFGLESDLVRILQHPTTSIACDCDAATGRVGHPRYYGTFPRVLGRYVREQGVLTWEDAVRKMTGLPATTIGLVDRGFIAAGMAADLVVFDPETVIDHSTYTDPTAPAEGILHVLVNGRWALRNGAATGAQAGRVLVRSRNLPARSMSLNIGRRVDLEGEITRTGAGEPGPFQILLRVTQDAADAAASGRFHLSGPDGLELTALSFGLLQTAGGWAGFTARAVDENGAEVGVTVVVDGDDPFVGRMGTTVFVTVEGETVMSGHTLATAEVLGEE